MFAKDEGTTFDQREVKGRDDLELVQRLKKPGKAVIKNGGGGIGFIKPEDTVARIGDESGYDTQRNDKPSGI